MVDQKALERYEIDNCRLREHLLQQEFILQKKEILLQKSVNIIQEKEAALKKKDSVIQEKEAALKKKDSVIQEKERTLKNKNTEIIKHLTSFRYQAGTYLYEATQSLAGFLMLPIKLLKLYIRYKKSK